MADNWTVLLVGVTETDNYGNLWITPQGGGDKVKIAAKRSQLHSLFQQGKAVMCNWQTYQNKPYVADAKPIEGELPAPTKPDMLPEHQAEVDKALTEGQGIQQQPPNPQAVGMMTKEIGDMMRAGKLAEIYGAKIAIELVKWYRSQTLGITRINYDGKDLPSFEKKES